LDKIYELQTQGKKDYYSLISKYLTVSNDTNFKKLSLPFNRDGLMKEHKKLGDLRKVYNFKKSKKECIQATKYSDDLVELLVKVELHYKNKAKKTLKCFEKAQLKKEDDGVWRLFNITAFLEAMNL